MNKGLRTQRGILAALTAYVLWGFFPIYWKSIEVVPVYEILCHRVVWSLLFLIILLSIRKHWKWLKPAIVVPKTILPFVGSAVILAGNWLTYIWGVNSGYIVETSLGYFINPLINVLLGVIFLKERLRRIQWFSILIALAGVLYLTFQYGQFPWIALTLAFSFGFYGLIRKTGRLSSLEGLSVEMAILFIPALLFIFFLELSGSGSFLRGDLTIKTLLPLAGVVTSVPLLFFAFGARNITLTTLGLLQYVAPSLQLMVGVFIYHESFPKIRMFGFMFIWIALLIYSTEGILVAKKRQNLTGP
jgi:chloramphenicol-sensitive protein RarD